MGPSGEILIPSHVLDENIPKRIPSWEKGKKKSPDLNVLGPYVFGEGWG
jgi:hypothetical protein